MNISSFFNKLDAQGIPETFSDLTKDEFDSLVNLLNEQFTRRGLFTVVWDLLSGKAAKRVAQIDQLARISDVETTRTTLSSTVLMCLDVKTPEDARAKIKLAADKGLSGKKDISNERSVLIIRTIRLSLLTCYVILKNKQK